MHGTHVEMFVRDRFEPVDSHCSRGNIRRRWRPGHLVPVVGASLERFAHLDVRTRVYEIRSEEHTSELQSRVAISYAVFCLTNNSGQSKASVRPVDDVASRTARRAQGS